ncbi:MAG TPA: ABC transporter permease [Methylomirabilota bacterium]|jgi:putative spermidine/putrescine transport system permease protein|nr:ABC transporter permease [Methylomirabilota bacterium]
MGRWLLRAATGAVIAFLYTPIAIIALYAFNAERIQVWPIRQFSTEWFGSAWDNPSVRAALGLSIQVGLLSSLIAIVLGSLAAFAVHRFRFFGREVFSLSLVLPIALPGIVTGLALNASARTAGISFSTFTIVLGHATFCIVVVYNNVIARLRRSSHSIEEASMDLGADTWQTFRYITFPVIRTAVLAGGLLAFALSFDEIVVTTFTAGTQETIPIWIFNHLRQANQRPIVNVVALVLILLSTIPVYLASRLTTGTATSGRT